MGLEKKGGNHNQIRKLIYDEKEIDEHVEILNKIKSLLFKSQSSKNVSEIEKMLCAITTLSFNNDQINLCEKDYLYSAIKNKQNNKSHGDDGLTKDFYEGFWNEIKKLLIASVIEAKG